MQNFTINPLNQPVITEGLLKYCGAINEEIKKQISEQIINSFFHGFIIGAITIIIAAIIYIKVKK